MNMKELFKNKTNLLNEDKAPTHLEMFKHHKDLEASKWKEVNSLVAQRDEINNQYIQAIKSGDKDVADELKKKFYDIDSKAVKTAEIAREHRSMATNYHASAQKSPDYKPDDFDYKPTDKSIEKSELIQKEGLQNVKSTKAENLNQDNIKTKQESTTDASIKVDQSKQEPSVLNQAKEQTKAPTEFKKVEPVEENPTKQEVSNKISKQEPSVLNQAKEQTKAPTEFKKAEPVEENPTKQTETKVEAPKQEAPKASEPKVEPTKTEAPKQTETAPKTAEPNHPNITKPVDAQPIQPQVQNQPIDNSYLTGGVNQLNQSNPLNKPQIGNQQVVQQPVQPAPIQPQPAPIPNHPNITKPVDAQPIQPTPVNLHPSISGNITPTSTPQSLQGLNANGAEYGSGAYKLDPSNSLNSVNLGHTGATNTGITTSQPSMIPSSGQIINNTPQPVPNPVDHWTNFKQSFHDASGHLKNFAGQQYHNIKQNLGQQYQNIKQNASEHLNTAKQFATDHAHEIAGAGALGAAGLAAYAAYKHFKNKKKQSVSQSH